MGDECSDAETTEVAHVAIGWATNLLSPTCGNSMACKTRIHQPAEQATLAIKENTQQRWICQSQPNHTTENYTETTTETATDTGVLTSSEQWKECNMEILEETRRVPYNDSTTQAENEAHSWWQEYSYSMQDQLSIIDSLAVPQSAGATFGRHSAGGFTHNRQALEAPSVQQVTGGIPNTLRKRGSSYDERPLSSGELVEAPVDTGTPQRPLLSKELVEAPAVVVQPSREEHVVGDPCQTLCDVPYTGNCSSAQYHKISVPKCRGGDVSIVTDSPISGERNRIFYVALDYEFIQACNSTRPNST